MLLGERSEIDYSRFYALFRENRMTLTQEAKVVIELVLKEQEDFSGKDIQGSLCFGDIADSTVYKLLARLEALDVIERVPGLGRCITYRVCEEYRDLIIEGDFGNGRKETDGQRRHVLS